MHNFNNCSTIKTVTVDPIATTTRPRLKNANIIATTAPITPEIIPDVDENIAGNTIADKTPYGK